MVRPVMTAADHSHALRVLSLDARQTFIALESAAWLSGIALGCVLVSLGVLSLEAVSLLCLTFILGLIFAAWKNFEGGRHPCFLFLAMLFVFQCSRLIGYITGTPSDPFAIEVQSFIPFGVSPRSAEMTLLAISVSAVCIYIPCRFTYRKSVFSAGPEQAWLRDLYIVLALTLPFAVYKNYLYLSYIFSHGGYLAVYTENAAILESAGILVRSVALVGTNVCLLLYLFERRRWRIRGIVTIFLAVSVMDLLIGFRGKFFVQLVALWFLRNLKTGRRFNFLPLFLTAIVIMLVAAPLAEVREERSAVFSGPLVVLASQGISMNVTEVAIENPMMFRKNTGRYLWGDLRGMLSSNEDNLASDMSIYLNPAAFSMGFATGSTYLAEAYVFGGLTLVVLASLAIGIALSTIHLHSHCWRGAVVLLASLSSFIYMPRGSLIDPITGTLKSLAGICAAAAFAYAIRAIRTFLEKASWAHV